MHWSTVWSCSMSVCDRMRSLADHQLSSGVLFLFSLPVSDRSIYVDVMSAHVYESEGLMSGCVCSSG